MALIRQQAKATIQHVMPLSIGVRRYDSSAPASLFVSLGSTNGLTKIGLSIVFDFDFDSFVIFVALNLDGSRAAIKFGSRRYRSFRAQLEPRVSEDVGEVDKVGQVLLAVESESRHEKSNDCKDPNNRSSSCPLMVVSVWRVFEAALLSLEAEVPDWPK
jgi:hypothetical protein